MLELKSMDWHDHSCDSGAPFSYAFDLDAGGGRSLSVSAVSMLSLSDEDACAQTCDVAWMEGDVEVAHMLVELFSQVPQVTAIFIKFQDSEFIVWTILRAYDREEREKVYEREMTICSALKMNDFDFRVTSKDLMSPDELTDAGYLQIFARS